MKRLRPWRCGLLDSWFDNELFGHRDHRVPDIPAAKAKGAKPEEQLENKGDGVALLAADFFCRIGSAAARAGERRGINLMGAGTAWHERHSAILLWVTFKL